MTQRVIAFLILAAIITAAILSSQRTGWGDFQVYLLGAERMTAGDIVYKQEPTAIDAGAFTYPPFFALPFIPFTLLPESSQRFSWYVVNLLFLFGSIWVFHRVMRPFVADMSKQQRFFFFSGIYLLTARFIVAPIQNQSHDLIVYLALLLALGSYQHGLQKCTGFLIGFAAACKVTPLLLAAFLFWKRQYTAVGAALVTIFLLTLLPDFLFPSKTSSLWVLEWYNTFIRGLSPGETAAASGAWLKWNHLNQSFAGTLYRLFTVPPFEGKDVVNVSITALPPGTLKILTLTGQAVIGASLLFATWPRKNTNKLFVETSLRRLGEFGAVLSAMLLLSPMSSKAHFCSLMIPVAFLALSLLTHQRLRRPLVGSLLLVMCLGTLSSKGVIGSELGRVMLAGGSVTFATLICFLASVATLFICGESSCCETRGVAGRQKNVENL